MPNFFFTLRAVHVNGTIAMLYTDSYWKSAVGHNGGVLYA